jgi:glycine oxidase
MTRPDISVVGGGLLGRCLAWRASKSGARVVLYDASSSKGEGSAAWVAGGMIAPTSEGIDAGARIESMGKRSLQLWPQWIAELPVPVFYGDRGTLMLWHREDGTEALRVEQKLAHRRADADVERIDGTRVAEIEPTLGNRFSRALFVRGEAQIDNRELLSAVAAALVENHVDCHWETFVEDGVRPDAGIVVDCRGMGARRDWRKLRGVRGEIVRLDAPEVELRHVLRLLNPRYPVYIIPRDKGRIVVGATSIESDDRSPVSVRGVLELLTAAYSVLPALAEARVLEFNTQVRPALPDNAPAVRFDPTRKTIHVNGLYRHGFLLTPAVVEELLASLSLKSFLPVDHEVNACSSM